MAEHSYADALTVAHMWEWVTTGERLAGYSSGGHTVGWNDPVVQDPVVAPRPAAPRAANTRTHAHARTHTHAHAHILSGPPCSSTRRRERERMSA
jgi:hypothetical protein